MLAAMDTQSTLALAVFATVYPGMILGGLPRLHLDRTGVALLGAIALIGGEALTVEQAARAVHLPTMLLLFASTLVLSNLVSNVPAVMLLLPVWPRALAPADARAGQHVRGQC
jgi:di/tricarboxylate transporter